MAGTKPRDRPQDELLEAVERAKSIPRLGPHGAKERERAQAIEAMMLRLAGLTQDQIAEKLDIELNAVQNLIEGVLTRAANPDVVTMRELENQRLDRVQATIWTRVLEGDDKAIGHFIRISQERSKLNGLYAPTSIRMRVEVRQEMEEALQELQVLVLGETPMRPLLDDPPELEERVAADGSA